MIAEFIPRKRHRDAIDALALVDDPSVTLAFAGDGPLAREVWSYVSVRSLNNRVIFLGLCRDVAALLQLSVATILPSQQEGLPRSVMESLSAGVPALVSNIRGNRDLVWDGNGGLTFEVGDYRALGERMDFVWRHRDEARVMGQAGRERMAEYDLSRLLRLHEELYQRVMEGHCGTVHQPLLRKETGETNGSEVSG
jgi:glycosyltransferase involved in cell wall biosynthesis